MNKPSSTDQQIKKRLIELLKNDNYRLFKYLLNIDFNDGDNSIYSPDEYQWLISIHTTVVNFVEKLRNSRDESRLKIFFEPSSKTLNYYGMNTIVGFLSTISRERKAQQIHLATAELIDGGKRKSRRKRSTYRKNRKKIK